MGSDQFLEKPKKPTPEPENDVPEEKEEKPGTLTDIEEGN